jgi:hypothetical protein
MLRWIILGWFLTTSALQAQVVTSTMSHMSNLQLQSHLVHQKQLLPSGFLPVILPIDFIDSLSDADTERWQRKDYEGFIMRKLKTEHLFQVRKNDFTLNGDVIINLEMARQLNSSGKRLYTNSRGYRFNGTIGSRFFFETSFYESQAVLPYYMDSVAVFRGNTNTISDLNSGKGRGSIPGYGRWKPFNTSSNYSFDYTLVTGTVGVRINKNSFVQFGSDKQFVGYGYRSLLLSDVSAPYPFLRLHLAFFENKLTYTTNYAMLQSLERLPDGISGNEDLFARQGARFSYLHFEPKHWFGIGLFDATTWTFFKNSTPRNSLYFSPHAFAYNQKGIVNHLMGLNAHVNPLPFLMAYTQVAANTRNATNLGYQFGLKILDPIPGLNVTLEYNHVAAGMYESNNSADSLYASQEPFQNPVTLNYYQHNDQMLGHPLGVESNETLLRVQYRLRDFMISGAYNHVLKTKSLTAIDSDYFQFEAAYIFNTRSNTQLVVGNINRTEHKSVNTIHDTYTYIAFRTQLTNRYFDF